MGRISESLVKSCRTTGVPAGGLSFSKLRSRFSFFETSSYHVVAKEGLELVILLLSLPSVGS
jgi:hypothetical protein